MNPNINLHIDSIVVDGVDLAPGHTQLLQQIVASQLTTMLSERVPGHSGSDLASKHANRPIRLGATVNSTSLGPQLANAIYANIPPSHFDTSTVQGGQS